MKVSYTMAESSGERQHNRQDKSSSRTSHHATQELSREANHVREESGVSFETDEKTSRRKKKVNLPRTIYEDVRKQCLLYLEEHQLVPGQRVVVYQGRIITVTIEDTSGSEESPYPNQGKNRDFYVFIYSDVRGILRTLTISAVGKTALEATTLALRELEDQLCLGRSSETVEVKPLEQGDR